MEVPVQMPTPDFERIESELKRRCPSLRVREPMSKHTTFGAGGAVRFFSQPQTPQEVVNLVRAALKGGIDYIAVGRGSNLLVRDGGYNGLMIRVASNLATLRLNKRTVYAEAGVSFTRLGRILTKNGRPGFEFAIGIPGSVGGAVRMNAGAFGSEIARVLKSVKIVNGEGRVVVLKPEELAFRYRQSELPPGAIVLSAIFDCPPGEMDPEQYTRTLQRKKTQPLSDRSFGSTFKNPPNGFAAELIERCGLKGTRRGGAMISTKHANFVVNTDEDTKANDVEDLIKHVIKTVREQCKVRLSPEVIIIGDR